MAWNQSNCYFDSRLKCSGVVDKWKCQCPNLRIYNRIYRNVSFFNSSTKLFHNFQGIYHYIVNLWTFCVYSIIRYWHHAKFVTRCRITIWALKQNGRKVCVISSPVILSKIRFICINQNYFKLRNMFILISVHKWSRFSMGYQMTSYCTLSYTFLPFCIISFMT